MILVTVGTHSMPFDRLLTAVDRAHATGVLGGHELVIQSGSCRYVCTNARQFAYCSAEELDELLMQADIVISHGGIGTLLPALRLKKHVIAIPRLQRYGEHYNDHQVEVCRALTRQGVLLSSEDETDLGHLLTYDWSALATFDLESTIVDDIRNELRAFAESVAHRRRR